MKNQALADIIKYATQKLNSAHGYCGVADGDNMAMLNSNDGNGNDIRIFITVKAEEA